MNKETKQCQNCKNEFTIEPEDFTFYEKIKVPPPTFCPECRLVRRLSFNNQRSLYKRKCDLCGKDIISMYAPDIPFPIYCQPCWWSDRWDAMDYGRDYDFSKPFFEQFKELQSVVPAASVSVKYQTLENSEYVNQAHNLKNCYLLFNSDYNENCIYGSEVEHSEDCVDMMMSESCSLSYGSVNCAKCYRVFFSLDCRDSQDIWFSKNLVNCTNCFGCVNLRNQKYHIFNKLYSKDEYFKKLETFNLGSYDHTEKTKQKVHELYQRFPNKFMHGAHNTNVSGDYIDHSKNTHNTFIALESEDCKYCMWLIIKGCKDCYDFTQFGENTQNIYETWGSGINLNNVKFGVTCVGDVRDTEYTQICSSSANIFGCTGLGRKQYCILNKQYTKESFDKLRTKIIEHMNSMPYIDKKGRAYKYGEFFPIELSPYAYNESVAQEYFTLSEAEAKSKGFRWQKPPKRTYQITIKSEDLPDNIKDVDDSILNEVIGCQTHKENPDQAIKQNCTTAFKIIPQELEFYKKMNLPLPRLCPNCRHYQRLKQRNPLKLWYRKCQCAGEKSDNGIYKNTTNHSHHSKDHCPNEFETTYSPDRKEIVYCEKCYQDEVV